jgi:Terpene cyclase DEP1
MKPYLIVCCIAGIVIPYWFALPFFLIHGPNSRLLAEEVFATRISSFFAADLILSSVIFLGWSRSPREEDRRMVARSPEQFSCGIVARASALPAQAP